jgi:hypothetical protein
MSSELELLAASPWWDSRRSPESQTMAAIQPRSEPRKFPFTGGQELLEIGQKIVTFVGLVSREARDGILRLRWKNSKIGSRFLPLYPDGAGCSSVVSILCCQVEVSATS